MIVLKLKNNRLLPESLERREDFPFLALYEKKFDRKVDILSFSSTQIEIKYSLRIKKPFWPIIYLT
jgi:hypothetical protein